MRLACNPHVGRQVAPWQRQSKKTALEGGREEVRSGQGAEGPSLHCPRWPMLRLAKPKVSSFTRTPLMSRKTRSNWGYPRTRAFTAT